MTALGGDYRGDKRVTVRVKVAPSAGDGEVRERLYALATRR